MTTNRDKINAMTNKELADILLCDCAVICNRNHCFATDEDMCHIEVVKWLESEVEE